MIRRFQNLIGSFARLFGSGRKGAGRPTLLGMYLGQANQSTGAGTHARSCRQREDGKYAQLRRRE